MKRILDCQGSDFRDMTSKELLAAIGGAEGRTIACETIGSIMPMLGDITNAEFAAAMGADILLLNVFDVQNPVIRGLPKTEPDQVIAKLKVKGLTLALATNPIFPAIATESRMRWAGLDQNDFVLYTTYENSRFCKPNPEYYRDILNQLGAQPQECLMVGNDVTEDMVAQTLGMQVFLLTDCLINKQGKDISAYPQGSFDQLLAYIDTL